MEKYTHKNSIDIENVLSLVPLELGIYVYRDSENYHHEVYKVSSIEDYVDDFLKDYDDIFFAESDFSKGKYAWSIEMDCIDDGTTFAFQNEELCNIFRNTLINISIFNA